MFCFEQLLAIAVALAHANMLIMFIWDIITLRSCHYTSEMVIKPQLQVKQSHKNGEQQTLLPYALGAEHTSNLRPVLYVNVGVIICTSCMNVNLQKSDLHSG